MRIKIDIRLIIMAMCCVFPVVGHVALASPYANELVSFSQGSNGNSSYADGNATLGMPSRTTPAWGGGTQDVTVFNAPWATDQIVSIGTGGSLVVKFDHHVLDNPSGTYWGIDFLIFGNTMYTDSSYPDGVAGGVASEPGKVQVSQDGINWYDVTAEADGEYCTQGYANTSTAYGSDGDVESDFTKPVDPSFTISNGTTYSQILAGYNGSGGGTGVDFSSTGLSWIQFVKVYQNGTDTWSTEIDAFADVAPEPATMTLLGIGAAALLRRRK